MSNWKNKKARDYLSKAKEMFGEPTFLANVENGMAYWKMHGNDTFVEHILRDENVRHCVPKPHSDFFYSSIKLYIPPSKLEDVLKISGSINYDGLKKLLTARCGGVNANIATLYLGAKVAMGEYSIDHVKKKGLYSSHIRGEAIDHDKMKKEINRLRSKNRDKYSEQLKLERYPLAYKKCPK